MTDKSTVINMPLAEFRAAVAALIQTANAEQALATNEAANQRAVEQLITKKETAK